MSAILGGKIMKEKILGQVIPHFFDGYFLISFGKDWLQILNEIPKFTIKIDKNGRLSLVGPVIYGGKDNG